MSDFFLLLVLYSEISTVSNSIFIIRTKGKNIVNNVSLKKSCL